MTKPHFIFLAFAIIVGGTGAYTLPACASAAATPTLSNLDSVRDVSADALLAFAKATTSPEPAPVGLSDRSETKSKIPDATAAPKPSVPGETEPCDKSTDSATPDRPSNEIGRNEACLDFSKASSPELQLPGRGNVYSAFTVKLASLSPLLAPSVQYSLPTEPFDWMRLQRFDQAYFIPRLDIDLA